MNFNIPPLSTSGTPIREGVLIVARRKKDEDLEDLVDDLDELEVEDDDEEEDEDVEVEDDDDEDPDEAPKARRKRSSKAKKSTAKKQSGIGTKELAEAAGVEPRVLRHYLRSSGTQPKGDRDGRYNWKSLNDPEAKKIIKAIQQGQKAEAARKAKAEAKGSKKSTAKKSTAKRTRAKK